MEKYELSFYGPRGFDLKRFETKDEALEFAMSQSGLGVITPDALMVYDEQRDVFIVVGRFEKKSGGAL